MCHSHINAVDMYGPVNPRSHSSAIGVVVLPTAVCNWFCGRSVCTPAVAFWRKGGKRKREWGFGWIVRRMKGGLVLSR